MRGHWVLPKARYVDFYQPENEDAEYYYEAILNSEYVKPLLTHCRFKKSGAIEKRMYEIGIPKFDKKNKMHARIVKLAKLYEENLGTGLGNKDYVSAHRAVYWQDKYAKRIEELMEKMLGEHKRRYMILHSGWYSNDEKRLAQI